MCYSGDTAEVYRESWVHARRHYRCDECRRDIAPGERHEYVFMVFEGDPSQWRTCAHCRVAQEWLSIVCYTWLTGGLAYEMEEHWDEASDSTNPIHADRLFLGRMRVGIRRRWRARGGGLLPIPTLNARYAAALLVSRFVYFGCSRRHAEWRESA